MHPVYPHYAAQIAAQNAAYKAAKKPAAEVQKRLAEQHQAEQSQQSSSSLEAAHQSTQKTQQGKAITLGDILTDVTSTMDALGVDEPTRHGVTLYLRAIEHQAAEKSPSRGFVRESLKVIGHQLDEFIGVALKQPSRVVMDWVDALLMQPIDYKLNGNASPLPVVGAAAPVVNSETDATLSDSAKTMPQPPTSQADSEAVLAQARQLVKSGDTDGAIAILASALQDLPEGHPARATLTYALARVLDQSGQTAHAQTAYETLVTEGHATPRQQLVAHQRLAGWYEDAGNVDAALAGYASGVQAGQKVFQEASTKAKPAIADTLAQLENDWGSLLFTKGHAETALTHLSSARQWAVKGDKSLLPDIYSNLAQVWEAKGDTDKRNQAYLKGMNAARKLGDQSQYLNLLARYQAHVSAA